MWSRYTDTVGTGSLSALEYPWVFSGIGHIFHMFSVYYEKWK